MLNSYYEKVRILINQKSFFFFQIGVFLILSAPIIGAFFLLISLLGTHFEKGNNLLKNRWIWPFLLSGLLAILSSINLTIRDLHIDGWNSSLSWLGLGNWIPFFYFIWRAQIFMQTKKMREKIANMFLAGTVPLIFSSFGQLWFGWHGPLIFLNGLIIWFQRSINFESGQGITAMFNNQNYAACWLVIIWPFCINKFLYLKGLSFKRLIYFFYSILLITCIYLTKSRGGLLGTITSTLFNVNKYFLVLLLVVATSYAVATLSFVPRNIQSIFRKVFSEKLLEAFEFSKHINLLNDPRIFIYINAIPIIMERPFLGWGASTFPIIFNTRYPDFPIEPLHPHNLIFEMANSYGLIFALIISITIFLILIKSFRIIFIKKEIKYNFKDVQLNNFDRAWWSSFFGLFITQMFDVQYFDFRISISFWILLTGLICIVNKEKSKSLSC